MVPPDSAEAERLAAVRAALPALAAGIYLNTGTSGPLPAETAAAMTQQADYELQVGRGHPDGFLDFLQRMDEARAAVAAVLVADVDDIALTHGATDGVNAGIGGIDWAAGDRAVTTRHEHPAGSGPLILLRERRSVEVDFLDIGDGGDPDAIVAAFDAAIDDRTRAVVISHVLWTTGAVMPVAEVAAIAHARGAIVVVDGAQAAGAIPIDLAATAADVYAVPGQKWLLGPEGTGAMAIARGARDRLRPSSVGGYTFERIDPGGEAVMWPTARRFDVAGFHRPSVIGFARSIGWLSMYVGLDWIHERGRRLARRTADRLAEIPGVTVLTPRDRMATIVTFRVAGWTADQVRDELGARVFAVTRTIPWLDAVRLSIAFFLTEAELDRSATAIEEIAAHTPGTIPRRTLTILDER